MCLNCLFFVFLKGGPVVIEFDDCIPDGLKQKKTFFSIFFSIIIFFCENRY